MKKGIRILLVLLTSLLVITGCDNKKDIKDIDKVQKETINENKEENSNSKKEIFYGIYYFALGSRRVKIYDDGTVYEDVEIENPRHVENYIYLKSLSNNELKSLKNQLDRTNDKEELKRFVIQLVYGVKEFGNRGEY